MKSRLAILNLFAILFVLFISGCVPKATIAPSGEGMEMTLKVKPGKSDEVRQQYAELAAEKAKKRLRVLGVRKSNVETAADAVIIIRTSSFPDQELLVNMVGRPVMLELKVIDESIKADAVFMAGNFVKSVEMEQDPFKKKYLLVQLNAQGSKLFADYTARNRGRRVAVTIDGRVYFTAMIREKIMGGKLIVKGFSSDEEAEALEIILKAGPYNEDVELLSLMNY
jgi:preprotein translocase subunit SecD